MRVDTSKYLAYMVLLFNRLLTRQVQWTVHCVALGVTKEGTKNLGFCDHSKKQIVFNSFVIERMFEKEFSDLLIHEVAHALLGPKVGHGHKFFKKVKTLGGTPTLYLCKIPWNKRKIIELPPHKKGV